MAPDTVPLQPERRLVGRAEDLDDQVECPSCGRQTNLTVVLVGACHAAGDRLTDAPPA